MTSDLSPYSPVSAEELDALSQADVVDAYIIADEVLDKRFGLQHWKNELSKAEATILSDDDNGTSDDNFDADIRKAMELSLLSVRAEKAQPFPTSTKYSSSRSTAWQTFLDQRSNSETEKEMQPPFSRNLRDIPKPPRPRKRLPLLTRTKPSDLSSRSSKRTASISPVSDYEHCSPPRRRKTSFGHGRTPKDTQRKRSPLLPASDDLGLSSTTDSKPRLISTAHITRKGSVPFEHIARGQQNAASHNSSASQFYSRNSAGTEPHEDVIEGDLEDSTRFVQAFVGHETEPTDEPGVDPERKQHRFQLLKRDVWDRPYFRSTMSAISHIKPIGENAWELTHPRLREINPDDFRFAAEYLADGDFGHRQSDSEDQAAETFAQCMAAWEVAQQLNMDDLQEHIIEKIQATAPWDLFNTMAFACCVYSSPDLPSEACATLQDMLSAHIAEHFGEYVRDDSLREQFLDRLQQIPKLAGDVHGKVAEGHRTRSRPSEQERELLEQQGSSQDAMGR